GNEYRVSAASFFQVNPFAIGNLVDTVADAAGLQGSETLVDAYGGVGLFSFALCRDAARVFLIESDASALRDARAIADAFRAQNVTIVDGSVERAARRIPKADTIICDPPREGAGPGGIRALVSLKPRKLVYVACDPASLARDSNILRAEGFRLAWAQPLDMFPHTYHVETVALFER
ncbi:MAG TPA: RsmD family RNA methyltransferase, partial [Candidatus Latescibacteria bacterium]|nr:RsmD family RNA methyltransferase [Candidatus Latescibacterota bacterium]